MTITSELNGTERYVVIDGRLDTNSSPQLEAALDELTDGVTVMEIFEVTGFDDILTVEE